MKVILEGKMFAGYQKPDFVEKESGDTKKGKYVIQLLTENELQNGEIKVDLLDVSIPDELIQKYKDKKGSTVQIECKYFAKSSVNFYGV